MMNKSISAIVRKNIITSVVQNKGKTSNIRKRNLESFIYCNNKRYPID